MKFDAFSTLKHWQRKSLSKNLHCYSYQYIVEILSSKIAGRDELGRVPEGNLLNRACARELLKHLSGVLVSSRTPFRPSSRRIENVSILSCFATTDAPIELIFSYIEKNYVSKIHTFHDSSV